MRIFVSSSFEDLKEHRAAAIRVLRQLGHEVLAMEDMVAGSAPPLAKVYEMVDRSDAYVGIFAWRYGHVPDANPVPAPTPPLPPIPVPDGTTDGATSITHYEFLRSKKRDLPIMAFLLDEHWPWPPELIDGFDKSRPNAPENADKIRNLRLLLQQERVVSRFTTPSDLEARVSAAVTMAGLTSQLQLQDVEDVHGSIGNATDSGDTEITKAIVSSGDGASALRIDLAQKWWSTRLYLIAILAERLTRVRRIIIVDSTATRAAKEADPAATGPERFIGLLATKAILATLGAKEQVLANFATTLRDRKADYNDMTAEVRDLLGLWRTAFGDAATSQQEESRKVVLNGELLRRWFGDSLIQQPLRIPDLQRGSVVDLIRLLDYPNDYVPVLTRDTTRPKDQPVIERVQVIEKNALNARLARNYLVELIDRARLK